jgi:hypothetical protein
MTWTAPHALDVLVSPQHGFFFWTPLAVLAVAGLTILAARPERVVRHHVDPADARRIGAALLAMVACQIYVSGSVESWTVAGAFGQRRFVALTSLLVVGLAVFWRAVPSGVPRAAAGIVLAAGVWWNVALMAEFATGMMDRQRLELRRNAYDAFVTLPRMAPELAWRYLTARESFYRPPAGNGR